MQALQKRVQVRWQNVPRKVLAFYYPWYGNPDTSGRWVHWEGVETEKKQIANSTHYPTLGPYDSHDPKTVAQHCEWAKQAGLDGFISSWWHQGDFHDKALPLLLDTAQKHGLEVTIYYEVVPNPGDPQSAVDDFLYLLNKYGSHPAWLKVASKPVIFVYGRAMGQLGMLQWAHVLTEVERRYPKGVFAVADQLSRLAARLFDGIHTYNTCGSLTGKTTNEIAPTVKKIFSGAIGDADRFSRISCVTVIPGYDDTKIRKPGLKMERLGGNSYRRQWEAALELDPHWVLITSFNEWHEGSEIEPSAEDGDLYIRLTAEYAKQFKSKAPRETKTVAPNVGSLSPEKIAALRQKFTGKRVAVLPDARSEAAYWLLSAGITVDFLTWEQCLDPQILTPSRYPILLYAGGENYVQSFKSPNDVDEALLRYLRAGGCLVAMADGPFPFYYNEKGPINTASQFGLPLGGSVPSPVSGGPNSGFEAPPKGIQLTFHTYPTRLPNTPKSFPFPAEGDQRWRPFLGRDLPAGDRYVPLIELTDSQGWWWGDAVAFAEHKESEPKGAKVCYVWFRLLEVPEGEAILYDVFSFLAENML